jgi:hypothetical protein
MLLSQDTDVVGAAPGHRVCRAVDPTGTRIQRAKDVSCDLDSELVGREFVGSMRKKYEVYRKHKRCGCQSQQNPPANQRAVVKR